LKVKRILTALQWNKEFKNYLTVILAIQNSEILTHTVYKLIEIDL